MGLREQSERKAPEKYFTKISLKYAKPLTCKLGSKSLSILYQKVICEWNWSLTVHIFQTSNVRHTYCLRASQTEIKEQWHCTQPKPAFELSLTHCCHRATLNPRLELPSFFNLTKIQEISGYFCNFYSFGNIFPFYNCIINIKSVWLYKISTKINLNGIYKSELELFIQVLLITMLFVKRLHWK